MKYTLRGIYLIGWFQSWSRPAPMWSAPSTTIMVIAYWLVGREIVHEIQGGEGRAEHGKQVIEPLSALLKGKYGRGFSVTNLRYFRTFYTVYSGRIPEIRQTQSGVLDDMFACLMNRLSLKETTRPSG